VTPVPGVYLDTSALGRVVLDEPDSDAISEALAGFDAVVSSRLLGIELHRLGLRAEIAREEIETWLNAVALVPVEDTILTAAETISPASVATLDAIHLATAVRLATEGHVEAIMTFDRRLAEGAREHGLPALSPDAN